MTQHELFVTSTQHGSRDTTLVRWAAGDDIDSIRAFQDRIARRRGPLVVLDRAPDLIRSYRTEGAITKLLIEEHHLSRELTSCAALSYKEMYINGSSTPKRVGYLGSLLTQERNPRTLKAGFSLIDSIQPPERPSLWLTTILRKNARALRTLGSGRSIFGARYAPLGLITTYIMNAGALLDGLAPTSTASFTLGSESQCDGALRWHGYPAPIATSSDAPSPLWHSLHEGKYVRATGALLDCRSAKRWRVQASPMRSALYSLTLGLLSVMRDLPSLSALTRLIFLHGVTAHPDDKEGFKAMLGYLAHCATRMYGRDIPLCIGIHGTNPFVSVFRTLPSLRIESCLFKVSLPHDVDFQLDGRPWHIDVGGL